MFSVSQVLLGCLVGYQLSLLLFLSHFKYLLSLRKIDCREEKTLEILVGLAAHIEALNLAIQPTLTEQDKEKYLERFNKWLSSYLAVEPLKRVRLLFRRDVIASEK